MRVIIALFCTFVLGSQESRSKFMLKSTYMGLGEYDRTDHGDKQLENKEVGGKTIFLIKLAGILILASLIFFCIAMALMHLIRQVKQTAIAKRDAAEELHR